MGTRLRSLVFLSQAVCPGRVLVSECGGRSWPAGWPLDARGRAGGDRVAGPPRLSLADGGRSSGAGYFGKAAASSVISARSLTLGLSAGSLLGAECEVRKSHPHRGQRPLTARALAGLEASGSDGLTRCSGVGLGTFGGHRVFPEHLSPVLLPDTGRSHSAV